MFQKAKQRIKDSSSKIKSKGIKIRSWISEKYRNNKKKCRGVIITLLLLALSAGLIISSFKAVDSLSQGVPINYTEGLIKDETIYNAGKFLGLSTSFKTIPNIFFLITFDSARTNSNIKTTFPSIIARVKEGIKLQIVASIKVRAVPTNLKMFLQNYGFEIVDGVNEAWEIYIKEKIRNVIIQKVATFRFYQISNKDLSTAINNQFISYQTTNALNFPFIVRVVGIDIKYPKQAFIANQTLGIRLLQKTSLLNQLQNRYTKLNSDINSYSTQIENYQAKRGVIEGQMSKRELAVDLSSKNWISGIQQFNASVQNQTLLQKYLQIYFNSLYNVVYRPQTLQPFKI